MKSMFLAVAAVLAISVSARAADLSSSDLAQCGLSGMQTMSDAQGMQIRAQGLHSLTVKTGNINVQVNVYSSGSAPEVINQQNSKGGGNISVIINRSSIGGGRSGGRPT